jgi:hypothetical protein
MYKTHTGQHYLNKAPALNRKLSEMEKCSSPSGFCHLQVLLYKHFPKKATAHTYKTISNLSPVKTNTPLSCTCKIKLLYYQMHLLSECANAKRERGEGGRERMKEG